VPWARDSCNWSPFRVTPSQSRSTDTDWECRQRLLLQRRPSHPRNKGTGTGRAAANAAAAADVGHDAGPAGDGGDGASGRPGGDWSLPRRSGAIVPLPSSSCTGSPARESQSLRQWRTEMKRKNA
jgi:hypothetical protein